MRVLRVEIENFRGVAKGLVEFPGHALLVGPNNACKSTVLEALDLALGPDRVGGPNAIDEHDFNRGAYLPGAAVEGAEPTPSPAIAITVTLGDLSEEELTRFRAHVETWHAAEGRVHTPEEAEDLEPTLQGYVLRVRFNGGYDPEEDEFRAETIFVSPEGPEGARDPVTRGHKRAIGFLYLRSLRTARRAASMQRGSLLDVLMNLADAKPKFWQELLVGLSKLGETASADANVRGILDALERALGAYMPRPQPGTTPVSRLNVGPLTRENLRSVMTFFLTSMESGHLLPFDRLGSGMTNILVLSLLTLIAERKTNVIFAMEEPEIAIGPTVQRRIVAKLKEVSKQALLTSHSPYVAEQMLPDDIVVLRRGAAGALSSSVARPTGLLKERILRADFRQKFAEGLLGNSVVIVEGVTEMYALPAASDVLAGVTGSAYRPLDLLGVVPVPAEGDGELAKVASFFSSAGIDTYVFSDTLNDAATRAAIGQVARDLREHPHGSMEELVSKELALADLQRILAALRMRSDYPAEVVVPGSGAPEAQWRSAMYGLLKKRKAEGYCALAIRECAASQLPASLRCYLGKVHAMATGSALPVGDPLYALVT
jgi:putative ATP-dependent endonuclease of OLD family